MSLAPGTRLGPYEITAKLGEGGMGEVYRAHDSKLERDVAIKILPAEFVQDQERLARFEREAKLLAQLNHPNIAHIYGMETSGESHALVMELVEGPTLADRLAQGPLPFDEASSLAKQIAEALEEAHEKGIVHRDLKPQNVKASIEGKIKVLDFGLAKAMDASAGSVSGGGGDLRRSPTLMNSPTLTAAGTQLGVILGTAAYMAPEQAKGLAVDKRADIWAFGVVLFEMLTGKRLFEAPTVPETLALVLTRAPDLGELPAATPVAIRQLLRRCLERNPRNRLHDIADARIVIDDVGSGRDATEPSAGAAGSKRSAAGTVALALLAVVGGALAGWSLRARLVQPVTAEPMRVHPLTFSGKDGDPAASPDGKLVAFTSWRDGVSRIWIQQLAGGGEAPLTSGPDRLPRFSPDGSSLLFVRETGTGQAVFRVGLVGGEPRKLLDDANEADWSPDGKKIVFLRNAGPRPGLGGGLSEFGILDLESGRETVVPIPDARAAFTARWSPDARAIAIVTAIRNRNSANWMLSLYDVATGKLVDVPPGTPVPAIGGLAWTGEGRDLFYIQAGSILGDIAGSGSLVQRCDPRSGKRWPAFWEDGLAAINASVGEVARADILGPGRMILAQRSRRQGLREITLDGSAPPRLLAEGSSIDRQPTYSPDGRRVLFSSNRGGNLNLWSIDRESGVLRQVTDDQAQDWDPAYTPDGRQIVWDSDRGGHLEVWIASADGSGARQVTHDGMDAENPTLTPDGRWIVYWSGHAEHGGVWKIRADGSGATQLWQGSGVNTDVSPDGRYVAFVDQDRGRFENTIRFVEVDSGRVVPFTIPVPFGVGSASIIFGRPRWGRDGRSVYYIGSDERGLTGVYRQEFAPGRDTSSSRRAVAGFSTDYVTESLGLSPDGKHLTISTGQESAQILVAEGVPGALPPARKQP